MHARLLAAYKSLPASVPSPERPARAADLAHRQRQLELAEELAVLEGALAGVTIPRLGAADAAIVVRAVLAP
jgi:hypothetical protein